MEIVLFVVDINRYLNPSKNPYKPTISKEIVQYVVALLLNLWSRGSLPIHLLQITS